MIQALETDPSMSVILGMGSGSPSVPFERAEFVRADQTYSIMNRIVKATQVDTILHTFMITNSSSVPRRAMHEINVIGTMNLLAAAGAAGVETRTGRISRTVEPRPGALSISIFPLWRCAMP